VFGFELELFVRNTLVRFAYVLWKHVVGDFMQDLLVALPLNRLLKDLYEVLF
jgi:hypothetical protein